MFASQTNRKEFFMTQLSESWLDLWDQPPLGTIPNFCNGCRRYWEEKGRDGQQIVYSYASVFAHVPRVLCPRCFLKARIMPPRVALPPGKVYEATRMDLGLSVFWCPRCQRFWMWAGKDRMWAADGSYTSRPVIKYYEHPSAGESENNTCPFCR